MMTGEQSQIAGTTQREHIDIINPVTEEAIGTIEVGTADDVRAAVERARAAQPAWEALGIKARARILRRWGDLMWENRARFMEIIRSETGKIESGALLEVLGVDNIVNYCYHHATRILKPRGRRALIPITQRSRVYYKPHGVVGLISPWNYPYLLPFMDIVAALAAGNTVVHKPSEITPLNADFAHEMMHRAGVPEDVLLLMHGDGSTGAALVELVDYISFTGSTEVGRVVARRAAERLIPFSMELGGKDPCIVLKDADLDMTASRLLVGALENAGQACVSIERVYIEAPIYDQLLERLKHYAAQFKVGYENGMDMHMGSMTNIWELQRTEAHIKDAVEKGAKVVFGGKRRPDIGPHFFEPTILVDVDHTMDVMREETFGPILPLMKFDNIEEAIRLANDNSYGLSGSIFTRNIKRGRELARQIDAGDIQINRTHIAIGTPDLPTGGQKDSGLGRRNGPEGLLKYVSQQVVMSDNLLFQRPDLRLADPISLTTLLVLRQLRRYVPWL